MNIKIIIFIFLCAIVNNNFCMLTNPKNNKQYIQKTYDTQRLNKLDHQKSANKYLKPFMLHSIQKNTEIFNQQTTAVKTTIIRQCEINNKSNPLILLMQLPTEDQFKIISYLFEDKCLKATEYFYCIPLEQALKKYNALPENNLTLLYEKAKLSQSIIFRLGSVEFLA